MPAFGGGKPYPPPLPDREEYVVEFDGHEDLRHAQNWPLKKKMIISSVLIFDALAATFASSILSAANSYVSGTCVNDLLLLRADGLPDRTTFSQGRRSCDIGNVSL